MPKNKTDIRHPEPLLLRAGQAAAICGLAESTFWQLAAAGKLPPSLKIGKARLWRLTDLRFWVDQDCPSLEQFERLKAGAEL